jgi:hypothetical protein
LTSLSPDVISIEPGHWTFAGSSLSIETIDCTSGELKSYLTSAQNAVNDVGAVDQAGDDASQLVSLAKLNGAIQTKCAAGDLWAFDSDDARLRLAVSSDSPPRLLAAAFGARVKERWQVTILDSHAQQPQSLLPMPDDAKVSCARHGDRGDVHMQLVTTAEPAKQLLRLWQDNGWETKHTPWGEAGSFSFFCVKDERVVYAWSQTDTGSRTIMVTRPPKASGQIQTRDEL